MFPLFIIEVLMILKFNNPKKEEVVFWNYVLIFYGVVVLSILISLEFKYVGQWARAAFNELLLELTLSMFFFMRNIQLRHFVYMYCLFVLVCFFFFIYFREAVI